MGNAGNMGNVRNIRLKEDVRLWAKQFRIMMAAVCHVHKTLETENDRTLMTGFDETLSGTQFFWEKPVNGQHLTRQDH